jgi:hypothetical protein
VEELYCVWHPFLRMGITKKILLARRIFLTAALARRRVIS